MTFKFNSKGFTLLELLVAVSVTGLLAVLLLNITTQVVTTQTKATGDLETNQAAQFILDRIQEDLQCAVYRNDGNVWLAATILEDTENSSVWEPDERSKPDTVSLRVTADDWKGPDGEVDEIVVANNQWPLIDSRFGVGGTWLRFFSQAPELDPNAENTGGVRAIGYQIVRYGLTGSETSKPRYQLFRSDVTAKDTFEAGYDLDPTNGAYGAAAADGVRVPKNVITPIFNDSTGPSTDFSLAANIIDFGIRAYLIDENDEGTGHLRQIFPDVNDSSSGSGSDYELLSTSNPAASSIGSPHAFPEVVDVMVRILTTEGASAISAFEEGLIPVPDGFSEDEYWWELAEGNSEVYVRRIRVLPSGI
ncbi:MAG: type II secretion system protein [Opitutae bacterium]|jgi:prepilin-type N-terminal cleavage/methylation domain-containing protein|nr:type II secretion system protein [Opitutae bacterium]